MKITTFVALLAIVLSACAPAATLTPTATSISPTTIPTNTPEPTELPPSATPLALTAIPTPVPQLEGRAFPAMAYDAHSKRVILFGGLKSWFAPMTDTWAFDPATETWTVMHPVQSPGGLGILAYDNQADRLILYMGSTNDPTNSNHLVQVAPLAETWAYDFETDTWSNRQAAGTPLGLIASSMAYDSESDRMILFGGADETKGNVNSVPMADETWAYDYAANTWTKMNPAIKPPARSLHAMAYDAAADRVILFGGYPAKFTTPWKVGGELTAGVSVNDTWAYDYNTDSWIELRPASAPAGRSCGAMVYDPGSQRTILVGGSDGLDCSGSLRDTWAYDAKSNAWANLGSAPQLTFHGMAFAVDAKQAVAFVGGSSWIYFQPALWLYSPATNQWKNGFANP